MAALQSVWLVILLVSFSCDAFDVDKTCEESLTEKDPHMSQYVGKTFNKYGEHSDSEAYHYTIGVCVAVNEDGCAVLQVSKNDSKHCLGKVDKAQVARTSDGGWIELTYTGGDHYHSHCGSEDRKTRIVFLCDPLIGGLGQVDFLEENRESDLCYYLFSVVGKAVCGMGYSWGDIVLIIFACLLGLWLLVMLCGCLYKRFVLGAKGWEQIPFLTFYQEFGNLQADGCDLICRSQARRPVGYKEQNQFAADASETEDEEKDDNLLPM